MRTVGDFLDVYEAARAYYLGLEEGCPLNPVVRQEGQKWILESDLEPGHYPSFETDLDTFHEFFYNTYNNPEYVPTKRDLSDFITMVMGE